MATLEPVFAALPGRVLLFVQDPWAGPHIVRIALRAGTPGLARAAADAVRRVAERNPQVVSAAAAALHAEGLPGSSARCAASASAGAAPGRPRPAAGGGA